MRALNLVQPQSMISPPSLQKSMRSLLGLKEGGAVNFFLSNHEAIADVVLGLYFSLARGSGKLHFITSTFESRETLKVFKTLEKGGAKVTYLEPKDDGHIDLDELKKALNPKTAFVMLSWVNPHQGVVQPAGEMGALVKENDSLFILEGSLGVGNLYFDFEELGVDYFIVQKGPGALLYERIEKGYSSLLARDHEESFLLSLEKALREEIEARDFRVAEFSRLKMTLEKKLKAKIPDIQVLYKKVLQIPQCLVLKIPGVLAETLAFFLERKKVHLKPHVKIYDKEVFPLFFDSALKEEDLDEVVDRIAITCKELKEIRGSL